MRAVCSRGPLAQPSHRFPFPRAQTNPALPCCRSHHSGPGAARSLPCGVWALGGSSRVTRRAVDPEAAAARALGALKLRWLPGAAIAATASCSLRGKTAVCALKPRTPGPAQPMGSLHHGSLASYTGLLLTSPWSLLSWFDLVEQQGPQSPAGLSYTRWSDSTALKC